MVKKFLIATVTFLVLDGIWLGYIANQMYINELGSLLRLKDGAIQANVYAAIVVYIALIGGLLVFVIPKADNSILHALFWGAMYGFVTYATYDFTNLAVLANWSLRISVIDVIWGMTLCGLTCAVTVGLTQK